MAVENGGSGGASSRLAVLGGAAGAVVLVVAGYLIFQAMQGDAPAPVEVAEPAPVADPVTPDVTAVAPDPPAGPAASVVPPEFDVVRVDPPNGEALVAGRAEPGAPVTIMVDGEEVASVEANASGEFVAMFSMEGDGDPKVVTLNAGGGEDVVASAENVIVTPPVAPPAADAATGGAEPVESADADPVADPEVPVDTAAAAETTDPVAPQVLLADESGITVLQDAGGTSLEVLEVISLDTIAYDEEGTVELAGRGREDRQVLVYLNNALIRTVRVGEGGQWRAPLPDVATGVYTLRVDEVDQDGTVTSRSETPPFKREEPDALVAAAVSGGGTRHRDARRSNASPCNRDRPSGRLRAKNTARGGSCMWKSSTPTGTVFAIPT